MRRRLILEISSTILEEIAIVVIVLWGLPQINVRIPIWGLILIMLAWLAYSVFTFRLGSRALKMAEPVGLPNMLGCCGEVVSRLAPEGMVRIGGELWVARSASGGEIREGSEVIVVGQQRLKLIVRENGGMGTMESGKANLAQDA